MRRRRDIPADPIRTTAETAEAVGDLVADALPAADKVALGRAIEALRPFARYLIPGEHLSRDPATLVAGSLACDIFTLHGEDAVGAEDPVAPPGAASETSWSLFIPVPTAAPFTAKEIENADEHLRAGPAPANASEAKAAVAKTDASRLLDLLDLKGPAR